MNKQQDFEIRMLSAMRKTLISVAKDTMTKPGLKHPLTTNTQIMITDCLELISNRQIEIEKQNNNHTVMKPKFSNEQITQSFTVEDLKKTLK